MNNISDRHHIVKNIGFSLLAEGTTLRVKTEGYSMYPTIKPGSVILIEPFPENVAPSNGEIIAWKRESGFVVHRLVRITMGGNKTSFITRGDSCAYEDQPVTREQIAGKVVQVETSERRILISVDDLISKPAYLYNRILVWVLVRVKKFTSPKKKTGY